MSITPQSGKGLVIQMKDYLRLRTGIGGSDYWYTDYQRVLLEKLHPFLPRMEYNSDDDTVTASIFENGKELLCESTDVGSPPRIPQKQLQAFKEKFEALKREVEAEGVAPDIKRVVVALELPDPYKSPELYRVYGKKQLAILWGLAKDKKDVIVADKIDEVVKDSSGSGGLKRWLVPLILLAAGAGAWYVWGPKPPPAVVDKGGITVVPDDSAIDAMVKQAVYKVHVMKDGKKIGTATAFAVTPDGCMITNAHVAKDFDEQGVSYLVESTDGKTYPVTGKTYSNEEDDLAVFKTEASGIPYLKLRKDKRPERGEYIYIFGYPLGAPNYFLTTGRITSVDDKQRRNFFFHDAAVSPGSSGSPVVDCQGQVVGVIVGNISDEEKNAQRLNIAVWVGALDNAQVSQPKGGHLTLPPNSPRREVPPPSTPQEDATAAKEAAGTAESAANGAVEAANAGNPEEAQRKAGESQQAAAQARGKAQAARDKANQSGKPDDKRAADDAEKAAADAQEDADRARKAAGGVTPPVPPSPKGTTPQEDTTAAKKAAGTAKRAADDAAKAASAGNPEEAQRKAGESQKAADQAKDAAQAARDKANQSGKPDDKRAADDAEKAAADAQDDADRARKAAGGVTPPVPPSPKDTTPQEDAVAAKEAADTAESAANDAVKAANAGNPEEAQRKLGESQKAADQAKDAAQAARDKANQSGKPDDMQAADDAEKAAADAQEDADRARKAAGGVTPPVPPSPEKGTTPQEDATAAKEAADTAENAANGAVEDANAGNPEEAQKKADESQDAADRAKGAAQNARDKADQTGKPDDKQAADDAEKSADDAQKDADKAQQAVAKADPNAAGKKIDDAKERADKALDDAKDANEEKNPQKAQKALDDAEKAGRDADNNAKGLEQKAQASGDPEDKKRADGARRKADAVMTIVAATKDAVQKVVNVELPGGIRFVARALSDRKGDPGKVWVTVRAEGKGIEGGTINGKPLNPDHSIELQISENGEEVEYNIRVKDSHYPVSGGCKLHVE